MNTKFGIHIQHGFGYDNYTKYIYSELSLIGGGGGGNSWSWICADVWNVENLLLGAVRICWNVEAFDGI